MKPSMHSVEHCLNQLSDVIDREEVDFETQLREVLQDLTRATRERAYAPVINVANSVLNDSVRTLDRSRIAAALKSMRTMVENVKNGLGYQNEKLEQEFFKDWLKPDAKFVPSEPDTNEISSVDFLEDDDDIEKFFAIEAKETIHTIRNGLEELHSLQNWRSGLSRLLAATHTLKGSAGVVGDKLISGVAHQLEEALDFDTQPKSVYIEFLIQVVDALEWLALNMDVDYDKRLRYADHAAKLLDEFRKSRRVTTMDSTPFVEDVATEEQDPALGGGTITLERLAFLMEEFDASRSMLVEDLRQIRGIGHSITESAQSLQDLIGQLCGDTKNARVDQLREVFTDVEEYFRLFEQRMEGCQEGTDKLKELSTRLWKEIVRSKRVPVGRVFGILQKTVSELSTELGVKAELTTHGGDIQVEKKVFETLFDTLVQLIRNSISHGIETEEERIKLGKDPCGKIKLTFSNYGEDLCIEVSDDGRGLDYNSLVTKASRKSLVHTLRDVIPEELIFISGLTTRASINEMAGRGIGMDVVAAGINKLNGMVQVDSEFSQFTTFRIRMPSSRFYTSAMIVRALGHLFAVPCALVNEEGDEDTFFNRGKYPMVSLTRILGGGSGKRPKVLVGAVEKRFYLEVDEVLGRQQVVFTKLGRFFKGMPLVWGATLVDEGEMAFVVNLRELFNVALYSGGEQLSLVAADAAAGKRDKRKSVLVVDDSVTVRERLKTILTQQGFAVDVAQDGREAMRMLNTKGYHLLVTDLEMPGVDGYELMEYVHRSHPNAEPPLLVISSKADAKERQRVHEAGASHFLSKPFSEQKLVQVVSELISGSSKA